MLLILESMACGMFEGMPFPHMEGEISRLLLRIDISASFISVLLATLVEGLIYTRTSSNGGFKILVVFEGRPMDKCEAQLDKVLREEKKEKRRERGKRVRAVLRMATFDWKPFLFGGLASMTAESGTFPIDLTKTRLQVQGQTIDTQHSMLRYRGMFHALYRIGQEEGFRALYSGIGPALLRQASYGTIKFGVYNTLKRYFVERPEDETLTVNVLCAVIAGVVSSSIANPTDVLKIRMQAQGKKLPGGMLHNFVDIYQKEGTRGLWRGVGPTAQRAAVVVGVELPVYDMIKKHLIASGLMGDTVSTHFVASFSCGLAGAIASNPIDVVRTRMMNQRVIQGSFLYQSTLHCFLQTWRTEGSLALYKGFWPNWLRLGPWNIIFFITFEQLKRLAI